MPASGIFFRLPSKQPCETRFRVLQTIVQYTAKTTAHASAQATVQTAVQTAAVQASIQVTIQVVFRTASRTASRRSVHGLKTDRPDTLFKLATAIRIFSRTNNEFEIMEHPSNRGWTTVHGSAFCPFAKVSFR